MTANTEIATLEFIGIVNSILKDVGVVFEVGSRDGKDSLLFKKSWVSADVYAFEAHPTEYALYKDSVAGINWVNKAFYNFNGEIDFYTKNLGSGIHSIKNRLITYMPTNVITVPCCRLDTFCETNKILGVDVIKIDVEGCSYEVLEGCGKLLQDIKIMHIETEGVEYFKGQKLQGDVFDFLTKNGFRMLKMSYAPNIDQHDSVWVNNKI